MMLVKRFLVLVLFSHQFLAALPASAAAPGGDIAHGDGFTITSTDLQLEFKKYPPPEGIDPQVVRKKLHSITTELAARRAIALEAERRGWHSNADVQAAIALAKDKVLADAWLEKFEASYVVKDGDLEANAQAIYKAERERFRTQETIAAHHILIAGPKNQAKPKAEDLHRQLVAGGDFEVLAKIHSSDKVSAQKGGNLGTFARGQMVSEFDDVAFKLTKPGELSELVETQFGIHIIRLDKRFPERIRAYDEIRNELINDIKKRVVQDARVREVQRITSQNKVNEEAVNAFLPPKP